MSRVLVTGSRNWTDWTSVFLWMEYAYDRFPGAVLVHGAARGLDMMAAHIWQEAFGGPVEEHPADWNGLRRKAGMVRNAKMVSLGADLCIGFPLEGSIGTYGCMKLAAKAGIEVIDTRRENDVLRYP